MNPTRLHTLSDELASAVRDANPERQRRAVLAACEFAARSASLSDSVVGEALDVLRRDDMGASDLRNRLGELAHQADDAYFEAADRQDEAEENRNDALRLFSRARALAALAFALAPDPTGPSEAIYEAATSLDDPSALLEEVRRIVKSQPSKRII